MIWVTHLSEDFEKAVHTVYTQPYFRGITEIQIKQKVSLFNELSLCTARKRA
jgi:hypothetical protein